MQAQQSERGAAAVEFALIAMLLITLLIGIMEFGRAWFVQATIAGAAREAVREFAIHKDVSAAQTAAINAAVGVGLTAGEVTVGPSGCPADSVATVTITHTFSYVTGLFGTGLTLNGQGSMRCGG